MLQRLLYEDSSISTCVVIFWLYLHQFDNSIILFTSIWIDFNNNLLISEDLHSTDMCIIFVGKVVCLFSWQILLQAIDSSQFSNSDRQNCIFTKYMTLLKYRYSTGKRTTQKQHSHIFLSINKRYSHTHTHILSIICGSIRIPNY